MNDTDTRSVEVEIPADVYRQLAEDDKTVADTLASLATDRVQLQRSISAYSNRDDGDAETDTNPLETNPPIAELLGFQLESVDDGEAVVTFEPGPEHANPMGTLHGGVLCDIGDLAMGAAYASTLADDESFTTLELDVKFRRPVWGEPLTATAQVMDAGRTVGVVTCDITGPEGELVAHLQSTCLTLRGDSAEGR
ncbi:PaaI family thioesterase [Natronomonas salina]|uniref:PaaI family thioesterase n=1 Tax=Natronomonas salina TaxID=1710540 RepID=UPI001BA89E33|nr:PaaI family thioesterase [Natronomonas salina]